MNSKIFGLIIKNLQESFSLAKYANISRNFDANTILKSLPWTEARFKKFVSRIQNTLSLESEFNGTIADIVNELDSKYSGRFFGEIWKPKTDIYNYTGWQLVDLINKLEPKAVLDVGCGYNQFKGRINNLIGIDPYNNCADYMVDILEYAAVDEGYDAIIALGSINFNSREDIELRIDRCIKLLSQKGKMFFRVNPGIQHTNGPWVDVFHWTFEVAYDIAKKYNLELTEFKKDANDRLFFGYSKK
jgi:hypothetical protein